MFSYYGRKTKTVSYYPKPKYDIIIEPFAGSAVYSLYQDNWEKQVILVDKYELIIKLWKYLSRSNYNEIISLPDLELRQDIRKLNLPIELRWLVGFYINQGSSRPKNIVQKWGARDWYRNRRYVAHSIYKIKHWEFIHGEYNSIKNIKATWFIDPPYQHGNKYYTESTIDYKELKDWLCELKGQVIVCENTKADWIKIQPLKVLHGQLHKTVEGIHYRENDVPNKT